MHQAKPQSDNGHDAVEAMELIQAEVFFDEFGSCGRYQFG